MEDFDLEALESFRPASNEFIDWIRTYGPMESFGTESDEFNPNDFEANLIWTESWRVKRLISSGFEVSSDSHRAITLYYVATNPWSTDSGQLEIMAEGMVPCSKCKGEDLDEPCVACDGEGEYLVDFCDSNTF